MNEQDGGGSVEVQRRRWQLRARPRASRSAARRPRRRQQQRKRGLGLSPACLRRPARQRAPPRCTCILARTPAGIRVVRVGAVWWLVLQEDLRPRACQPACLPAHAACARSNRGGARPSHAPRRPRRLACRYCTERWTSKNSVYALLTSSTSTAGALRRCATRLAALISWMAYLRDGWMGGWVGGLGRWRGRRWCGAAQGGAGCGGSQQQPAAWPPVAHLRHAALRQISPQAGLHANLGEQVLCVVRHLHVLLLRAAA